MYTFHVKTPTLRSSVSEPCVPGRGVPRARGDMSPFARHVSPCARGDQRPLAALHCDCNREGQRAPSRRRGRSAAVGSRSISPPRRACGPWQARAVDLSTPSLHRTATAITQGGAHLGELAVEGVALGVAAVALAGVARSLSTPSRCDTLAPWGCGVGCAAARGT